MDEYYDGRPTRKPIEEQSYWISEVGSLIIFRPKDTANPGLPLSPWGHGDRHVFHGPPNLGILLDGVLSNQTFAAQLRIPLHPIAGCRTLPPERTKASTVPFRYLVKDTFSPSKPREIPLSIICLAMDCPYPHLAELGHVWAW